MNEQQHTTHITCYAEIWKCIQNSIIIRISLLHIEYVAFLSKFIRTHNKIDEWNKHIINIIFIIIKSWCACTRFLVIWMMMAIKTSKLYWKLLPLAKNPNSTEHRTMDMAEGCDLGNEYIIVRVYIVEKNL